MTCSGQGTRVAPAFRSHFRLSGVLLSALLLLALLYWAVAAKTPLPVGFWSDDATYVATARSLAQGTGYRHIQIPGEPLQTRYPPLYPALLSLAFGSGLDYPANLPLLLIPGALAASGLWLMSVAYWRRVFEAPPALLWCAGALALLSPVVLAFVRYTMSDLVYAALSLAALLCLESRHGPSGKRDSALVLGGALLVALSVLTRSVGITLLAAALISLLVQRRWAHAGILLTVVLGCCGPWLLWQIRAAAENGALQTALMTSVDLSYGLWLPEGISQLAEVLRQNALRILFSVVNYQLALPIAGVEAALASPSWRTALLYCAAVGAAALCVTGFVSSARRRWTILHGYLLLYGGLIWLWPFEPHRFLVPWTPFILYFLLAGVFAAVPRGQSVCAALATLAIGSLFVAEDIRIFSSRSDGLFVRELAGGIDCDELAEAYAWIEREIPETALIASAGPGGVYLNSGRRGYFIWPDTDPYLRYYGADREAWRFYAARSRSEMLAIHEEMSARFRSLYAEHGIRYYLHQPHWLEARVMDGIAAKQQEQFELLYTSSGGAYRLYHIKGLEPRPNIALITIESLRTDHVGFQGARNDTTPFLDALAAESVVYEDAHSVTSWTLASHASIFTGLYPPAHQAVDPAGTLHESYSTTAEILRAAGYQTAGVASGPYLRTKHKLHQGFEIYDDSITAPSQVDAHGDVTNPAMLEALERFFAEQRDPARPFFLFAYFWDPHFDYKPPPPYDEKFRTPGDRPVDLSGYEESEVLSRGASKAERAYVMGQYDGEIAATDAALEELFESMRRRGLWENTAIFVTADHGEEFLDHGQKGHKNNLFVESVHVPLLVKYPSDGRQRGGRRDDRLVSLVDLHPTILELAGALTDDTETGHGQSLLEVEPDPDRAIYFDLKYVWFDSDPDAPTPVVRQSWRGVRRGDHKLVTVAGASRPYLFDVVADPREKRNLSGREEHEARKQSLEEDLRRWRSAMRKERRVRQRGADAQLDEAERARLRALGYLND